MSVGQLEQEMNIHKKHVIRNQRTGKDIVPVSRSSSRNNIKVPTSTTSGVLEARSKDKDKDKDKQRRKMSATSRRVSLGSSPVHPTEAMGQSRGGGGGGAAGGGRRQSSSGAGVGRPLRKAGTTNDLMGTGGGGGGAGRRLSASPSMTADGFAAAASTGGRRASVAGGGAPSLKGVARAVMVGASGSKKSGSRRGSVA